MCRCYVLCECVCSCVCGFIYLVFFFSFHGAELWLLFIWKQRITTVAQSSAFIENVEACLWIDDYPSVGYACLFSIILEKGIKPIRYHKNVCSFNLNDYLHVHMHIIHLLIVCLYDFFLVFTFSRTITKGGSSVSLSEWVIKLHHWPATPVFKFPHGMLHFQNEN